MVHNPRVMNYTPIPGYPRYEIGDDRFTIRCVKPYKKTMDVHFLRPFLGYRCSHAPYVNVRDASDVFRCMPVSKLAYLALGPATREELPRDLVEIPGFSNYRYSPSEGSVVRFGGRLLKTREPHRLRQRGVNIRSFSLMADNGKRVFLNVNRVAELAKGGVQ